MTQTDPSRRKVHDEIIARIDALVSPVALEDAHRREIERFELFHQRFEHTLIDLDLGPASGITIVLIDGAIAIRTRNRQAAEILGISTATLWRRLKRAAKP